MTMKAETLRKSILQYAIQGKLVPQIEAEEPARVLLQKIAAEKQELIKQGKIKKEKLPVFITEDEKLFDIPDSWEWVRLSTICVYIQRGKSPKYSEIKQYPVISQKCVQWNGFSIDKARFIAPDSIETYAYAYVEGFLKLFWLIYGYAYDHHWLDGERYTADFLNKSTKLRMPKKNEIDEDLDISIYTQEEIGRIAEVLKDTNIYISFLIGYYCGLRVSECMGLMWKDFNEQDHTLKVGKQMLYNTEEHMFYLATTKTVAGKRTVYVPDILYNYLIEYKEQQRIDRQCRGYKATEVVLDGFTGKEIQGGDFIQRKKDGGLITINSIKYWTRRVKELTDIRFHYHALRHTNASMLAANNVPKKTLAEHLGHANTNIAEQYYIGTNEVAMGKLQAALNSFAT